MKARTKTAKGPKFRAFFSFFGVILGILTDVLQKRFLNLSDLDKWLDHRLGGWPTNTGREVDADTAMQNTTVNACVRVLAETIGALPLHLYRRLPEGGKERATNHPLYSLLHDAPNPEMTAIEFRECMVGHLCLWGNFFAEIERGDRQVNGLWPLRPDRMTVARNTNNRLIYEYRLSNGEPKIFQFEDILHIRGLSSNGIIGYSIIHQAREAIGLALATEEYGAKWFKNGSRMSGVLTHPNKLSKEARTNMKESWQEMHSGLDNAHRIAILEEGVTWTQIGVPPEDAQFLQTRQYQRSEIAGLFRIPPHMIADVERSTSWGTGIEEQSIGFVTFTLMPWLVRIEQAIKRDLIGISDGKRSIFAEHLVSGLLRGDSVKRATALQIQRQNGIINADEWREIENMNPLENGQGKIYLVPLNFAPADMIEEINKPKPPPPPPKPAQPATEQIPPPEPAPTKGAK